MEVVSCIDAAFATNQDRFSKLGIFAMIRDKHRGSVNAIQFASMKSKRICKFVLATVLFAFVESFDVGFSIAHIRQEMLNRKVDFTLYTNSHCLYGLCVSLAHTTERRLQVDLSLARETYERRELPNIVRITGTTNPADDLTMGEKRAGALAKVVGTNFSFLPCRAGYIERKPRSKQPTTSVRISKTYAKKKLMVSHGSCTLWQTGWISVENHSRAKRALSRACRGETRSNEIFDGLQSINL